MDKFNDTATEAIDATPMLVEAAVQVRPGSMPCSIHQVIDSRTKHEELDVASHAITGSTAQLVANSRNKVLPAGTYAASIFTLFMRASIYSAMSSRTTQALTRQAPNRARVL